MPLSWLLVQLLVSLLEDRGILFAIFDIETPLRRFDSAAAAMLSLKIRKLMMMTGKGGLQTIVSLSLAVFLLKSSSSLVYCEALIPIS